MFKRSIRGNAAKISRWEQNRAGLQNMMQPRREASGRCHRPCFLHRAVLSDTLTAATHLWYRAQGGGNISLTLQSLQRRGRKRDKCIPAVVPKGKPRHWGSAEAGGREGFLEWRLLGALRLSGFCLLPSLSSFPSQPSLTKRSGCLFLGGVPGSASCGDNRDVQNPGYRRRERGAEGTHFYWALSGRFIEATGFPPPPSVGGSSEQAEA